MALSGNSGVHGGTAPKLRVDWSASQSISGNYSTVTANVYLVATYNVAYSATKRGSVTVNGSTKSFSTSKRISGAGTHHLTTQSFRVNHSSDGSKSFSYSASYSINITYSGSYMGTIYSPSASGTLNTIPRASSISSVTGRTVGGTTTVNISRASSSFTHTVWYRNPAGSEIVVGTANGVGTSVSFTIPNSDANGIPNKTGTGRIWVRTFSGSTQIGNVSQNITITVPDNSTFSPSVNTPSVSISGNGVDRSVIGAFVQGRSKAYLSGSASGKYGATIQSQTIEIKRSSDGANKMYGSSNTYTSGTLVHSGKYSVIHWVRDSRGHANSTRATIDVLPYTPPVISSLSGDRSGGAKSNVSFNSSVMFSGLGGKNSLDIIVQRRPTGGSWTQVSSKLGNTSISEIGTTTHGSTVGGNEVSASYEFRMTVSDRFTSGVISTFNISTNKVPFSIDKDEGIGAGKIHERGALDVGGDAYFNGRMHYNGEGLDFEKRIYNYNKGVLVDLYSVNATQQMTTVTITGNAYGATPVHTILDFYHYIPAGTFLSARQLNLGLELAPISIFVHSGRVMVWFKETKDFQTFKIKATRHDGVPVNDLKVSNSFEPTGVTKMKAPVVNSWNDNNVTSNSNSNGYFIKYPDGTMICWHASNYKDFNLTNSWGGVYHNSDYEYWTFPQAFTETPFVSASYRRGGGDAWVAVGAGEASRTRTNGFYLIRPASATVKGRLDYFAVGRWK